MLRARPHFGAEQLKHQMYVHVHALTPTTPDAAAALNRHANLALLWTRGTKSAITPAFAPPESAASTLDLDHRLTLICTLFRRPASSSAAGEAASYAEKMCTFALVRGAARTTAAKCKVDVSSCANATADAPRMLTLTLSKGSAAVATLRLSIWASRIQPSSREGAAADDNSSDVSDAESISSWGSSVNDDDDQLLDAGDGSAALVEAPERTGIWADGTGEGGGGGALESASLSRANLSALDAQAMSQRAWVSQRLAATDGEAAVSTTPRSQHAVTSDSDSSYRMALRARVASSFSNGVDGSPSESAAAAASVSRLEAQLKEVHAQLAAEKALVRKLNARVEEERADWEAERVQLQREVATTRQEMLKLESAKRQHVHDAQTAQALLASTRAEASRLRQEKKVLLEQQAGADVNDHLPMQADPHSPYSKLEREEASRKLARSQQQQPPADVNDTLATQADLQSRLDRSERHREEASRKLAKSRQHQQSLLADVELLSACVEDMEDEIGNETQLRLNLEKEASAAQSEHESVRRELDEMRARAERRLALLPTGLRDLQDQLDVADEVRGTLCQDIASLTQELVEVKLFYAQEHDAKTQLQERLRRATEKHRSTALRMTDLEVRLAEMVAERDQHLAEAEERIAEAFKVVMLEQEEKIARLQERDVS